MGITFSNVDGILLVDPVGLIQESDGNYQERWIQDREVTGNPRPGETADEQYARSDPIQISYDVWDKAPKTHGENGCIKDIKVNPPGANLVEPSFCSGARAKSAAAAKGSAKRQGSSQGFQDYRHPVQKMLSLSVAAISLLALIAFWATKARK